MGRLAFVAPVLSLACVSPNITRCSTLSNVDVTLVNLSDENDNVILPHSEDISHVSSSFYAMQNLYPAIKLGLGPYRYVGFAYADFA